MGHRFAADDGGGARELPADAPLLLALLRNSADLVGVLNRDGSLRLCIPERMLGHDEDYLRGRFALDLIHPDDVAGAGTRLLDAAAMPGTTQPFECRLLHADGSWRWFEIIGRNEYDNPEIAGLIFSGRDIDDRKRAEQALKASERRWRSLLQGSTEHISVLGPGGSVTFHVGTDEMLGYADDDVPPDFAEVLERTHPDDRERAMAAFAEALADPGRPQYTMARIRHADGSWRWIESVGCNLLDDPDVNGILISSRDVSEREAAALAKREAEAKVAASERRWRRVLDSSTEAVMVMADDGTLLQATGTGRILGFSDLAPTSMFELLDLIHPDDLERASTHLVTTLAGTGDPAPFLVRIRHADGCWLWVESTVMDLRDDPDVGGIVVTTRDVTQREEAEQARRQAEADAAAVERRWQRVLEKSTEPVTVVGADGTIIQSTANGRMLGYAEGATDVGEVPMALVHPDDVQVVRDNFARVRSAPGEHPPYLTRILDADGSWRWIESRPMNLLDDPEVGGIVFTTRDVTERKEAEAELAASERRWRRLVETSTEHITVVGSDGHLIFHSGDMGLLGYSEDELPADIVATLENLHPDDRDRSVEAFTQLLVDGGQLPPFELRMRHRDGSWRWLESFARNLCDDPDVGGLVVTSRDITQRAEAEARLRDETRLLETLAGVGRTLTSELDLEHVLQAATDAATELTGSAVGAFFHRSAGPDDANQFGCTVSGAFRETLAEYPRPSEKPWTPLGTAGRDVLRYADISVIPAVRRATPFSGVAVRSYLEVPVVSRSGEILGTMFFGHPDAGVFNQRGERLAVGIAGHAAVAIDNARLYQAAQDEIAARKEAEAELAHQATHDPLTGLPNRLLALDRLRQALARLEREPQAVGVLLLDLDRFKVVNDSLGHAFGDRVLTAVSERLRTVVRPGDTVARLGGDEFVIVCDGIHGEVEAVAVADRVRLALAQRFVLEGAEISLTASIGIATTRLPDTDPDYLMRDVDAVMYRAKERGRDRWEVFDEVLRDRVVQRLSTETALRRSLESEDLLLHFQPLMSLTTGQATGAEGLIRWQHPTRGLLPPGAFLQVAEESGLMIPLGERVLRDGCRQLARWAVERPDERLLLSLNVSAQQLTHSRLVRAVSAALDESGADPCRLSLELTETALLEDFDTAIRVLRQLRGLGIKLWVDDFGTGYSSLAYLRRLPLDGLKIDRSFVRGLLTEEGDRAIVSGTVQLAHSFDLAVLAEGVETVEQARCLHALGCTRGQGYLWSRPVAADDFTAWLDS